MREIASGGKNGRNTLNADYNDKGGSLFMNTYTRSLKEESAAGAVPRQRRDGAKPWFFAFAVKIILMCAFIFAAVTCRVRYNAKIESLNKEAAKIQMRIRKINLITANLRNKREELTAYPYISAKIKQYNLGLREADYRQISYLRIIFQVDFIKFYSMLKHVEGNEVIIEDMYQAIGELDALIAVASFRESLPYYSLPEFTETDNAEGASLEVEELYHPLIADPVVNGIRMQRGVLITGSNASGKSTFLKTIAINTILAQTVHTCIAKRHRGSFLKVLTSMALRDNLAGGESYYMVEIRSLKRILEECEKPEPVLCIVDEVLRGTNTIERIAASSQILHSLAKPKVLAMAATHDIELSYILEKEYDNYHFEEEIQEKDVVFDYKLRTGRAMTRNAIRLLAMIGYDPKIIEAAQESAKQFEETGVWK